jgi:hypothetical protein
MPGTGVRDGDDADLGADGFDASVIIASAAALNGIA